MKQTRWTNWMFVAMTVVGLPALATAADDVPRIDLRFAAETITETPDFRQHVVPLMGKVGCNGRACHGSFQGRGGFRLSLFGYDFKNDHEALTKGDKPRVNTSAVSESLMLQKPLQVIPHEGGTRLKEGTWQHKVFAKWIESGAKPIGAETPEFVRLEVTPEEIVAKQRGETFVLKAVAVWSNGTREDVTPLCRFQTNNDQIATIDDAGVVTSAGPGDSHVVVFYDNGVVPVPVLQPVSDKFGPNYPSVVTPTKVDELVVQKLRKLGMTQSEVCTDAEFLRRLSLDMIGTLPTAAEVEAFLADTAADKRAKKIDELLERPAYAAWWATKLSDWTGNNAGKLNNRPPDANTVANDWYEWLRTRVEKNVPYDQIAEGIILAVSRQEGESYEAYSERMSGYYHKDRKGSFADQPSMTHYWIRLEFQKPEERALGFAYTFLGLRIQCAQCHKHPFDQWTKDDFDRFKEFFSRATYNTPPGMRDEERALFEKIGVDMKSLKGNDLRKVVSEHLAKGDVVPFPELYVPAAPRNRDKEKNPKDKENKKRPQVVAGRTAKVLGGEEVKIDAMDDPREALMDWLRDDSNPYFARAIVNRVWANYFNVGIVEPVDDLSLANPPSNEALLDYLTDEFRKHQYDMKWLHRTIANSQTYQLSWHGNSTNEFDERNFARAVPRRLPAEVTYDALQLATMSDFEAANWQTSTKGRAIANVIVNNRRGNGKNDYALNIFGRSIRESNCECDRSTEASLLQTVFLQNDSEVLTMISGKGRWVDQVLKRGDPDRDAKQAGKDVKERKERRIAEVDTDQLKQRLVAAEKKGNANVVAAIKKELAERQQQSEKPAAKAEPVIAPTGDVKAIVRQAYLRTLSRYPTDAESDRAARYYEETGDLARGTKDLLWALLNTKEFVVNH